MRNKYIAAHVAHLKLLLAAALHAYRRLPLRFPRPDELRRLRECLAVRSERGMHTLRSNFPSRHAQVAANNNNHFEFLQREPER